MSYDPSEDRQPNMVSRAQWGAQDPRDWIDPVLHPTPHVYLTYARAAAYCKSEAACVKSIQQLQLHHFIRGAPDLPYSFLIGDDKRVYEGRGWYKSVPPPPEWPDSEGQCIVLAFLGPKIGGHKRITTIRQFKCAYQIFHYGWDKGNLHIQSPNFRYRIFQEDWNDYKPHFDYTLKYNYKKEKWSTWQ